MNLTFVDNFLTFVKSLKVVPGFEIGKLLGKGAFSKVKLAKEISTNKEYACKIIKFEILQKDNLEKTILKEITIHKTINHPNIVRLHKVFFQKTNIT